MGRGKLTMELIEKEKSRMITYQKRKRGLKKKAQEFATLCGVPTCMIVYGPRLNNRPVDVEVWPKDPKDFMAVVNLYRDKAFSSVRGVKSQNLFDFFADRKRKVDEKIAKTRKANYESKFSSEWDDLNKFSLDQLKEIVAVFDNNIELATKKLTMMKGHQNLIADSKPEIFFADCINNNNAQVFNRQQQQQPVSSLNMQQQLDLYNYPCHHDQYHQALHHHLLPFEFNSIDNPMMMLMKNGCGGGDQIQMGSTSSPYNHPTQQHPRFFDPMAAMIDNRLIMNNNPKAAVHFFGSTMQPLVQPYNNNNEQFSLHPSFNNSSQMHGHASHQFNEFYRDINEFRHRSDREKL